MIATRRRKKKSILDWTAGEIVEKFQADGWSLAQLESQLGIPRSTLSRIRTSGNDDRANEQHYRLLLKLALENSLIDPPAA